MATRAGYERKQDALRRFSREGHVALTAWTHELASTVCSMGTNRSRTAARFQSVHNVHAPFGRTRAAIPLPQWTERDEAQRKNLRRPRPGHVITANSGHE